MPGMPYHLEKGPWLSILEDYLNADVDRTIGFLGQLRAVRAEAASLADLPFLTTSALHGDPDYPSHEERKAHLQDDWFGSTDGNPPDFASEVLDRLTATGLPPGLSDRRQDGDAATMQAFAAAIVEAEDPGLGAWPTTGFWYQYFGDVEGIVRETLIRSIEVSLGLDHDAEVPQDGPPRVLPVELFWKCPQRWFEGWITWRWDPARGIGQVTSIFATPGSGKPVLEAPLIPTAATEPVTSRVDVSGAAPVGPGAATPERNAGQAPKGMWLVTQREHAQLPSPRTSIGGRSGEWMIPPFGPTYVGCGPIVCVQPTEADGGVKPFGRPFVDSDSLAGDPS